MEIAFTLNLMKGIDHCGEKHDWTKECNQVALTWVELLGVHLILLGLQLHSFPAITSRALVPCGGQACFHGRQVTEQPFWVLWDSLGDQQMWWLGKVRKNSCFGGPTVSFNSKALCKSEHHTLGYLDLNPHRSLRIPCIPTDFGGSGSPPHFWTLAPIHSTNFPNNSGPCSLLSSKSHICSSFCSSCTCKVLALTQTLLTSENITSLVVFSDYFLLPYFTWYWTLRVP